MTGPWDRPDSVAFVPSEAEFLAAARLTIKRSATQKGWAVGMAATALFALAVAPPMPQAAAILLGAIVAVLLAPLIQWLIFAVVGGPLARRINARRWEPDVAYRVSWTDESVAIETDRIAMRLPWTIYIRRRETDTMILLYHSAILTQFVPKRALNEAQLAALRPLLDRIKAW